MSPRKILISYLLVCAFCVGFAKTNSSTDIFDDRFKTLTVIKNDQLMADPVITLGKPGDYISFSFDELSEDRSYLRCRLIHCNADWQPSPLSESEYLDGFNQADIEDFGYSSNTFTHYVNYKFTLPAEGLQPLVSGNYLWQVYDIDNPDETILQARFRVDEDNVSIIGEANGRTDREFNDRLQQLSITVSPSQINIPNPYADIFVEVTQNMRPDTSRILHAPTRMQGNNIIYDHSLQLIYPAGNEYRRFETVRNNYPGMGVESTFYEEPAYHAVLQRSSPRDEGAHYYDRTQHGRFKIDEFNSTNPDLGADYIITHFSLAADQIPDADVYVEGDLTLRKYDDGNKMKYLPQEGIYALTLPLKQGSYNYQYVVVPRHGENKGIPDITAIEGSHYETCNEYNVYVWMRTPGARADRLLGTRTIYSE